MTYYPNLKVSAKDLGLIMQIVERAQKLVPRLFEVDTPMAVQMDITACHTGCCPLQLEEFLKANDLDFVHDVTGIHRYFDRREGVLTDCFEPRHARGD